MTLLPFISSAASDTQPTSLDGSWRFAIDRDNRGIAERWFEQSLADRIQIPGSMPGQGRGDPVNVDTAWTGSLFDKAFFTEPEFAEYRRAGNIKVPFWLQPDRYYAGAAWYQRDIDVPADWAGRRVVLSLERPHWETQVWLDGRALGSNRSLSTAHVYDLGTELTTGKHVLSIRVDNGRIVEIGENSHSISDHTQGNWNGIVGRVTLTTTQPVWIEDLQVFPQLKPKALRVTGSVGRTGNAKSPERIAVRVGKGGPGGPERWIKVEADGRFAGEYPLAERATTWDEFAPALHQLVARLENGETKTAMFGLREIGHTGRQLTLNGRPLFIRGTLECAIFPKTGHPPTDVASWKKVLGVVKAHGLNSVRFHSWCPPEAAFIAGDEMGVYFQIEAASWPNQSTTLGEGHPVDVWLEEETRRILRAYGNHACFVLMASGNEPGGADAPVAAYLNEWVKRRETTDARRIYTSGAGWPEVPANHYHVRSEPRIQQWGQGLKSRINALPPATTADYRDFISARSVPVISHEIGQWCVFPDFEEMPSYTGYLKPKNFEIFRETLQRNGLGAQAKAFVQASGKLQALCYKEDIEAALRTPEMAGFQLLDLHDFPGQGTALVGVLNAFWEPKGYISAEAFRRFCNVTVPLARLPQRVFTNADTLKATCEVAHFGAAPFAGAAVWRIVGDNGVSLAQGTFESKSVAVGLSALGEIAVPLEKLPSPARYRLEIAFKGTKYANDWDIWVYPKGGDPAVSGDVMVVERLDSVAEKALAAGGTVLLTIPGKNVRNDGPKPVQLGFSSIFWNTSWTQHQAPTTLGILCDPNHPALADFPTDFHSNWQWWYVLHQAGALRLDGLPADLKPVVQIIDDWFTSRRLGLVIEARVGKGKLLMTGVDLRSPEDAVTRQLRTSLLNYAASQKFAPQVELSAAQVRALMTDG